MVLDVGCPECSGLGRHLASITEIMPISASDPVVAGIDLEGRLPCLVSVNRAGAVTVHRGWRMRLEVARLIGWSNRSQWGALLDAEARARAVHTGVGRRPVILGGVAAIAGVVLGAPPAYAKPRLSVKGVVGSERSQLMAAVHVETGFAAGPESRAFRISDSKHTVLGVVPPRGRAAFHCVDGADSVHVQVDLNHGGVA